MPCVNAEPSRSVPMSAGRDASPDDAGLKDHDQTPLPDGSGTVRASMDLFELADAREPDCARVPLTGNLPPPPRAPGRRDQLAPGANTPLGEELINNFMEATSYWERRDSRIFQLSDLSLARSGWVAKTGPVDYWLDYFDQEPRVLLLFTRLAELSPWKENLMRGPLAARENSLKPVNQLVKYLEGVIPSHIATDQAIPTLIRAANAARVPHASVRLASPDGRTIPLTEHPRYG